MVKTNLHLSAKCRSCLLSSETMYNLFAEFSDGLSLSNILSSVTSFEVSEDDDFSSYICEICTNTIVNFFNFKVMYLENEKKCIQSLVNNKKGKQIISEVIKKEEEFYDEKDQIFFTEESNDDQVETLIIETCSNSRNEIVDYIETEKDCDKEGNLGVTFKRELCTELFSTPTELEVLDCHFKNYRKDNRNRFICEHCGAGFRRKCYLNDHAEVHSSERKYNCKICSKTFKRRTTFVKHRQIHTNPGQIICEMCGQRFNAKSTLKTHIKLKHTKEKKYYCVHCGMWFSLKSSLNKHIHRHSGNRKKKHVCQICPMAYKDKSSLNRHVLVKHSENLEKPSCNGCGKQYTTKTNLLKHMRKYHNITSGESANKLFEKCL